MNTDVSFFVIKRAKPVSPPSIELKAHGILLCPKYAVLYAKTWEEILYIKCEAFVKVII
jgi:hypothetical protein